MKVSMAYAWCSAAGEISTGPALPPASLPLARGEPEALAELLKNTAQAGTTGLAVPGMSQQTSVAGRLRELNAYRGWLALLVKQKPSGQRRVAIWRSPDTQTPQPQEALNAS